MLAVCNRIEGPGGYTTAPEVAWVVRELEKRNLTSTVAQFFLHDDDASASGAVADAVAWLRTNAPHITPQTNTFPDSGPETLYTSRQFIYSPEEYAGPCEVPTHARTHACTMIYLLGPEEPVLNIPYDGLPSHGSECSY